jgi:hypothetical protein
VRSFVKEGYKVIFDNPDCILVSKKTNQIKSFGKLDRRTNLWKLKRTNLARAYGRKDIQINVIFQIKLARLWQISSFELSELVVNEI